MDGGKLNGWIQFCGLAAGRSACGITQHFAVDESMIKCLSKFCKWIQHMPKKPITRGIQVSGFFFFLTLRVLYKTDMFIEALMILWVERTTCTVLSTNNFWIKSCGTSVMQLCSAILLSQASRYSETFGTSEVLA